MTTAVVTRPHEASPRRNSIAGGAVGVGLATLFASGANYASNVVLGRRLGPDQFADAALVVSTLLLLGAMALGLQLTAARAVAAGAGRAEVLRLRRRAVGGGAVVGALMVVVSPVAAAWFHMGSPLPLIVLGIGVPVYFVMAVARGVVQAQHEFGRLAVSIGAEAAARFVVTIACVSGGFGPTGAATALSVSFLVALAPCWRWGTTNWAGPSIDAVAPVSGSALGATVLLLTGQVIISNGDLWVVAARVPDEAGVYAAVALIGRMVFVAAWSVITVVFPSLVTAGSERAAPRLLGRAALITAVLGGGMTVGAAAFARPVMATMVGDGYSDGAGLLWPYALATTVFVLANLLAVADVAAGRIAAPAIVAGGGVVQTGVLYAGAAAGASWVVWAQVVLMSVLLIAVLAAHGLRAALGSSTYGRVAAVRTLRPA